MPKSSVHLSSPAQQYQDGDGGGSYSDKRVRWRQTMLTMVPDNSEVLSKYLLKANSFQTSSPRKKFLLRSREDLHQKPSCLPTSKLSSAIKHSTSPLAEAYGQGPDAGQFRNPNWVDEGSQGGKGASHEQLHAQRQAQRLN
mmetsp:Transcript_10930/g.18269  ORF Transcript_10930/g.18269 Transcript_10930/m.18269 type:complete len:141 (-) Transcript_10930:805-1227(-)